MRRTQIFRGMMAAALGVLWVASPVVGAADDGARQLSAAAEAARADLADALKRLSAQRDVIAAEKPELAAEFAKVEAELLEKRRMVEIATAERSERDTVLRDLKRDLATYQREATYFDGLLTDLGRSLRTAAAGPRFAPLGERLDAADDPLESLVAGVEMLEAALGGDVIAGRAVAQDGTLTDGQFVVLGSESWFVADDGATVARVDATQGADPHLLPLLRDESAQVRQLLAGGEAELALDFTGGRAVELEQLQSGPLELIRKGGVWVWPILLIAAVSLVSAVAKWLQIARMKAPRDGWVAGLLENVRAGEMDRARELAAEPNFPASEMLTAALERVDAGADVVEEVIYEKMIGVQSSLQSWLPFIAITAATAPLLGLLGTVSGMISTFDLITLFGSGDAKSLAGGISEALITTLFGLVVAIPSLVIHALLSRRCHGILQTSERLGITFVNGLRVRGKEVA
ncbi:MotA/TolQ/ExbB proton channel family protein [Sulfuriroseicoccus oceanibius]|uniref:MotA/TolQ/ExbB proton channel family protein n=1 Tax=Sulfuriroseicoccus oceanibius TaxID=2707525 RepID=A0A7T7F3V3_9BACT|nr:MotA/TolQ/ExbB proton channel family protein [Sulfuriroseicoccus oceanibius]QQL46322.1 MotA/TolQ/ExbB proton channel family protein [Sulfuriroseicoccus oceanibius]